MDTWFLDNLEKLVPIVIALLYFLGTSRAKKNEAEAEVSDPDAEERARKIQEEIRRKILERQQKGGAPAQRETPPELPNVEPEPQPFYPKVEPASRGTPQSEVYPRTQTSEPPPIPRERNPMEIYEEERRKVEKKLRKARELSARARSSDKKGTAYERPVTIQRQKTLDRHRYMDLMDELDDPISLRKAIVLKEILDRPVALR